ncbi:MAG: Lrp/AsnC family transcriptional regulator [Candidatus Micrarchaeota archaeon]|nr:Lrp/AsnC family transcriptional regulator [Candidatus Micrarchaeota archaeon]
MSDDLDKTDRKILAQLIENSKIQSKELSRKLKIHPNTLLQRLKKMEKSGIIKRYSAIVDHVKAQNSLRAMIFLNVKMEKGWEEILHPLSKIPEIVSFILITGEHDVLITARVRNELHLANLLRKMQKNPVVTKTSTNLILDYYKYDFEYNPFADEFR